jgi:ribose transport system ATP-binding protein
VQVPEGVVTKIPLGAMALLHWGISVLLELEGIQKRYGGVVALRRGDLRAAAGEVHLLLGENGAGKSTLMKIVAGMVNPDGGVIRWQGRPVSFRTPSEAAAVGIAMVHQESLLAPHLTVAENIFLGREERLPLGWVNRRRMMEQAARLIAEHHFPLQADWRVERLSPAGKQLVEICRAIYHGSSLLIFDEPTSSLSEAETQEVFRIVRTLRDRNMGVIYITHRLEELRAVGDRVTILRDGETVHTGPLAELSTEEIIRHMVGRELEAIYHREPLPPGEELFRVEGLSRRGVLHEISFRLHAGEIVGLAGLVGAGRTELCRALFGLDPVDSGRVWVAGKEVHIRSPREAVAAGLALIPEDRQRNGLAVLLPVAHNLTHARLQAVSPRGILDHSSERRATTELIARLRIRAESWRQLAGKLSGGNQQKVVVGKWLFSRARVFLFDEPARGIDVGAKAEVFRIMDELARSGAAVLMVSSELPELVQVADRILVMRQGRLVAELPRGTTQEEIMRHAMLEQEAGIREPGS